MRILRSVVSRACPRRRFPGTGSFTVATFPRGWRNTRNRKSALKAADWPIDVRVEKKCVGACGRNLFWLVQFLAFEREGEKPIIERRVQNRRIEYTMWPESEGCFISLVANGERRETLAALLRDIREILLSAFRREFSRNGHSPVSLSCLAAHGTLVFHVTRV